MYRHHRSLRFVVLVVAVALPLIGLSGVASAKQAKTLHCTTHPHRAACKSSAGGSGTGGTNPTMVVTVSPNPLVETAQSEVFAVVQVETSPAFAGDTVVLDFSQFTASCDQGVKADSDAGSLQPGTSPDSAVLDNDGNASFFLIGLLCAPGSSVIDASMLQAPYYTATTTLQVSPPAVTPAGVTGYPNSEVEIGDSSATEPGINPPTPAPQSTVIAVFYVETSPVYAEQTVEIDSAELDASCGEAWSWEGLNEGTYATGAGPVNSVSNPPPATSVLDDDGNAVFVFAGASCAAGTWDVVADVEAGTHPTYVSTFTVLPPAPTI
jgi:hypothetical protein